MGNLDFVQENFYNINNALESFPAKEINLFRSDENSDEQDEPSVAQIKKPGGVPVKIYQLDPPSLKGKFSLYVTNRYRLGSG